MRKKYILLAVVCLLFTIIFVIIYLIGNCFAIPLSCAHMSKSRKYVTASQYPMPLTHLLPEGFENTEFSEYLGRGGGYLFQKTDEGQIQYYENENSEWEISETRAYGGVVIYRGLQKRFEDGKLTFLSMPYNHYAIIEEEYLDTLEVTAVLWKASMDLYTHVELETIQDSRPTEAVFWCVMFCSEESDITYGLVMNAEYFDKKDILAIAESVEFSKNAFNNYLK